MTTISRANALIEKIQEHMNIIEMADIVIESLTSGEILISGTDADGNEEITTFEDTLTLEQKKEAKNLILCMLNENKQKSEKFLESLTGATESPKTEDSAPEVETPKKRGGRPKKTA